MSRGEKSENRKEGFVMKNRGSLLLLATLCATTICLLACPPGDHSPPECQVEGLEKIPAHAWLLKQSGSVKDEALKVCRMADSFPAADEDYFHDMDRGEALTVDEVKGRNNWIVWTGGNDRFWDWLSQYTFGNFDLLKLLSSHPDLKFERANRWYWFGLVNEPGFAQWQAPEGCDYQTENCGDPDKYGLWLDNRLIAPDAMSTRTVPPPWQAWK